MDDSQMWCPNCDRLTIPNVRLNYPMSIGVLGVLVAITIVFVWVTFLDRTWALPETVGLTLVVTVLPFGYMRLRRMKPNVYTCPDCGSQDLVESRQQKLAAGILSPRARGPKS